MTANEPPDDRRGRFVEQGNVRRRDEGGPTDEARAGMTLDGDERRRGTHGRGASGRKKLVG